MHRLFPALIAALVLLAATQQTALAGDDFLVPIDIGGKTYTLTVAVDSAGISVTTDSKLVTVGQIRAVQPHATPTDTADLDAQKATAVSVPYDDLFRNNEDHLGKKVRYVGEVVQVQENPCTLCEEPSYTLRIAVTEGSYGLWDDPIWVDYTGAERFLEDDIVTVWGIVEGLQKYTAVLGNQITVPQVKALEIQLGELADPQVAAAPDTATANSNANLRGGPGTQYPVLGTAAPGSLVALTGQNVEGTWYQTSTNGWVAAALVANAPPGLPIVPPPPLPPPTATPLPTVVVVVPTGAAPPATPTPTPTITPVLQAPPTTPTPAPSAVVRIIAVNRGAEWVLLYNDGDAAQALDGWTLRSGKDEQTCTLRGALAPRGALRIWAGNGPDGLSCGLTGDVWDNTEPDAAVLLDAQGNEVSRFQ